MSVADLIRKLTHYSLDCEVIIDLRDYGKLPITEIDSDDIYGTVLIVSDVDAES